MKRILPICFTFFLSFAIFSRQQILAQTKYAPAVSDTVSVDAQVGKYTVSLSGFIAPYASVVMTIDNTVVRSTVADANGYFYLTGILVKGDFNHYCLTAVDVKRLGKSKACFTMPKVTGNYTKSNIFLPPTLGLYKKQINAGQTAEAWGYTMPGATVTLHTSDGRTFTITADNTGYFEFKPQFDNAGVYELFADASYHKQQSENPVDKVKLTALSVAGQVGQTVQNVGKNVTQLISGPVGFLLLAIPIIILIIILLRKLMHGYKPSLGKGKMPYGAGHRLPFDFLFKKRKLHHSWYIGF